MTEKPEVKIQVSPEGIPSELKNLARWVLWQHVWIEKTQRWAKVPYQRSGRKAASDDSATWCSFADAIAVMHLYDGIGFVFNGDGITGIDLDHAVDDCGIWSDNAEQILREVPGYAELSPSGTGLHIITRTEPIGDGKRKNGVEAYSKGRYFTFTGSQINGHTSIPEAPQDIRSFLARAFGDKPKEEKTDLDIAIAETPRTFYQKVNALAMKAFGAWVPAIFPDAIPYKNGGYRISSDSLRRPLEEDISIVAAGIKDFGVADQGDPRGGKRSPIDLVIEWQGAKDAAEAANWLCDRLGVDPAAMGGKSALKADSEPEFKFYAGDDYAVDFNAAPELVEDVLPDRGIAMVYGPSGKGKTFWTLDLAFHVHNGVRWRDKDVVQGDVMYVAAEAGRGIKKRIQAVKQIHPEWRAPFVADIAPDLASLTSLKSVRDAALAVGKPAIVIIDTMSASFEGDDSSQQDIAKMMRNLKMLSDALACLVIFVHHTTKDGASYRGSGVLFANVDAVLELVSEGEGAERRQWVTQRKHREGEDGKSYPFALRLSEPLAYKPNGKPINSLTIEHISHEGGRTLQKKDKRSTGGAFETSENYGTARKYLALIQDLVGLSDANVDEEEVIFMIQKDEKDNGSGFEDHPPASNIKRTLLTLGKLGKIRKEGRWVRVC
jgi:KaiC/GvpD/RAD55 family RecA-like ATPase